MPIRDAVDGVGGRNDSLDIDGSGARENSLGVIEGVRNMSFSGIERSACLWLIVLKLVVGPNEGGALSARGEASIPKSQSARG